MDDIPRTNTVRLSVHEAEVVRRYLDGATMAEIAMAYGSSVPTVCRLLASQGMGPTYMRSVRDAKIAERARQGFPVTEIALELKVSQKLVRQSLTRQDIHPLSSATFRRIHSPEMLAAIEALRREGMSAPAAPVTLASDDNADHQP